MSAKTPKWRNFTEEEAAAARDCGNEATNFIKVGESEWVLPKAWINRAEEITNMEIKKDDTWVITYPRSGTTLTQELVWIVSNNFDFHAANTIPLIDRCPFLEYTLLAEIRPQPSDPEMREKLSNLLDHLKLENIKNQPSPRFFKTHLGFELLPHVLDSGCKIVYVARNPKDAMVSWYYFEKSMGIGSYRSCGFDGDLKDSWQHMKQSSRIFSPYWEHIKEAWAERHRPNVLFLFYENIVKDLPKAIRTIGDFLEKPYTDEQVTKLSQHLGIENFRANEMINPADLRETGLIPKLYIRKGVTGDSKGRFSPDLDAEIDEWIRDNLKDTDIVFPV